MQQNKKRHTPSEALVKAQKYCAYQERCHQEVRNKLYELGLYPNEVEEVIMQLIEQNFLNEERFAIAYAGGKFRTKKWGKNKILQELKLRKISDYCIRMGMKEIPDRDYIKTLNQLITKKEKEVRESNLFKKRQKIAKYLITKGYEPELVWANLKD